MRFAISKHNQKCVILNGRSDLILVCHGLTYEISMISKIMCGSHIYVCVVKKMKIKEIKLLFDRWTSSWCDTWMLFSPPLCACACHIKSECSVAFMASFNEILNKFLDSFCRAIERERARDSHKNECNAMCVIQLCKIGKLYAFTTKLQYIVPSMYLLWSFCVWI